MSVDEQAVPQRSKAGEAGDGLAPLAAVRMARAQMEEITSLPSESSSACRKAEEGWEVHVEVVELERVPDTSSILATYWVQLDHDGDLIAYERVQRYTRGQIGR
jgi:Gas vesicle synthesis protein GvpO